jgi:DNA (cytosine-5)-methyltransferase 1
MRYASVCSGIEAASVAWEPIGWTPAWFAEIEPFPCAVLAHHYPNVPNLGDMTAINGEEYRGRVDALVGGTPCQSFSVAGLRRGLDDERGNLALSFCRLADAMRPRWVCWENVPGVLSIDDGRAFGSIVGTLVECGYGVAWRVLDAGYYGALCPRPRVFVVGYHGDWRRAGAVLFDRASLEGDKERDRKRKRSATGSPAVFTRCGGMANDAKSNYILDKKGIRTSTPLEWERVMGFPDDYTAIPWRGKSPENCPDGPRYRAIGNSMAVPVMAWIGRRIDFVDKLQEK